MRLSKNMFKEVVVPKGDTAGNAGFDNTRENIDPHVKTKVVSAMESTVEKVPVNNSDVVNKLALDTAIAAIPGGGDVSASANLTDETIVQGDGGAKGVKTSTATVAQVSTAYTHSQDNTQAHSDYLKNDAADVGVGLTLTGDNSSADTAYVPMVLYNTDETPPAASGFPVGTIYVQYTA